MSFATQQLNTAPVVVAPDGSEVRILCSTDRGSMAQFSLPPGAVSRPVAHRSVEEIWYFVAGRGRMWRCLDNHEEIIDVSPGISITIPVGTRFQFRCDGEESLAAVAVTMPPWPGETEAYPVDGGWPPTV